jgi:hypothetical protein
MKQPLKVGDRVRLTAKFLRNTGQYTGREPFNAWTITGFSHDNPDWAVTDEPACDPAGYYSDAELLEDPTLAYRRVNVGNLERIK